MSADLPDFEDEAWNEARKVAEAVVEKAFSDLVDTVGGGLLVALKIGFSDGRLYAVKLEWEEIYEPRKTQ